MVNYLIIIAHADDNASTHSHKLADAAKETLEGTGNQVKIIDLIKAGFKENLSKSDLVDFDPSIPFNVHPYFLQGKYSDLSKNTQKEIEWANTLIIIGPIWFRRLPAIFYTFQDRVFTPGWAFDFSKKLEELTLYGKKALIVTTAGAPYEFFKAGTNQTSLEALLFGVTGIFFGYGVKPLRTIAFYNFSAGSSNFESELLPKFKNAIKNIETREVIPYVTGKDNLTIANHLDAPPL